MLKIIVEGRPLSKSNFKLTKKDGTPWMPYKGKHAKYACYEQLIAWHSLEAFKKSKYAKTGFECEIITVLKLYFPDKRFGDVHNYPKSICDGIEKSGIISNDKILKPFIILDYMDKTNPRVEIELYPVDEYELNLSLTEKSKP